MTDERLAELFAEGSAPERDAAFAGRIEAEIGREHLRMRMLAAALRMLAVLTIAGMIFVTIRVMEPALELIAESSPKIVGVPAPLVFGALAIGLFIYAFRRVSLRLRLR
jgi:hypothetical protein